MSRNLERQRLLRALAAKRKANPYGLLPGVTYGPKGASKGAPRRRAKLGRGSA
jgi:hypothetical protein